MACWNELLTLELNDIHIRLQLSAAHALLTAVDHSASAVEITSEDHIVQVQSLIVSSLSLSVSLVSHCQ